MYFGSSSGMVGDVFLCYLQHALYEVLSTDWNDQSEHNAYFYLLQNRNARNIASKENICL